MDRFMV